ncbi:Hypothetical protein A7982_07236 [Minicystis rosea]|nr:Hypothetical protein A7982_07236 [Minicystis rosea]
MASSTVLYALSKERGIVFAVPLNGHDASVLSSAEHEPFAVVVRREKPVWATADGVFTADGTNGRRALASGSIRALASGPDGVYYATEDAIWRADGSRAAPTKVVNDVQVRDELVVVGRSLVWREGREMWRFDLDRSTRTKLSPDTQRKPHGLATDGHLVFWHEGDADLLPGRSPNAFVADPSKGWEIRTLEGDYESNRDYLIDDGSVFTEGKCGLLARAGFREFALHDPDIAVGPSVVAANARSWYWSEGVCKDGRCGATTRVFGVEKAACRP